MTDEHMTQSEASDLAALMTHYRPDWPESAVMLTLQRHRQRASSIELSIALLAYAQDEHHNSPAGLGNAGSHWSRAEARVYFANLVTMKSPTAGAMCPKHPDTVARECEPCWEPGQRPTSFWKQVRISAEEAARARLNRGGVPDDARIGKDVAGNV